MYHLHPPIFVVSEESNFPDSWEVFCAKLLNLEKRTSTIVRRLPPESGVDLFDSTTKTAYQCKSVESGLTSGFNLTKIVESYRAAQDIKESLGWTDYVVCINTDLTGTQEANFKAALPDTTILTKSYWTTVCQRFPDAVIDNFKRIIPIPRKTIEQKIDTGFVQRYSQHLKDLLSNHQFDILFFSNRHSSVYRIPVADDFKVSDLLHILQGIFDLPEPMDFEGPVTVKISYSVVYNDVAIPLNKTMTEAGITENSIVTFWLKQVYSQGDKRAESFTMQMITVESYKRTMDPVKYALDDHREEIKKRFNKADKVLLDLAYAE